jgi:hypothetical protein
MKTAKHADPVMQELWANKDLNAAKFGSLASYLAHLRASSVAPKSAPIRNAKLASKRRAVVNAR